VFDVAGAYEHNEDTSAWYTKKANCFLFSCALDNRQSLLDLETNWIPLAKKILQTDVLPSILVANKDDDSAQRVITTEELEEFAQKHNIQCVRQVSAKTGKGIEELFKTAAHIAFDAKHGIHQVYRMLEARQPLQFVEPKMSPFLQKKKNCIVM
jgi:GTPase SAR1 family protein